MGVQWTYPYLQQGHHNLLLCLSPKIYFYILEGTWNCFLFAVNLIFVVISLITSYSRNRSFPSNQQYLQSCTLVVRLPGLEHHPANEAGPVSKLPFGVKVDRSSVLAVHFRFSGMLYTQTSRHVVTAIEEQSSTWFIHLSAGWKSSPNVNRNMVWGIHQFTASQQSSTRMRYRESPSTQLPEYQFTIIWEHIV